VRTKASGRLRRERQPALFKVMEHGIIERPKKSQTTGTIDEAVTTYLEGLEAWVANSTYCARRGKNTSCLP
jgi:hypothetical protein